MLIDVPDLGGVVLCQVDGTTEATISSTGSDQEFTLDPASTGLFRFKSGTGAISDLDNLSIKEIL